MNVRTFTATGDGVTDDRPAIQMAIDATIAAGGGVVFFPAGDYVVGKIPDETSHASFLISNVTIIPLVFAGEGAASRIRMDPGPTVSPGP
jgi:polygalacturonase